MSHKCIAEGEKIEGQHSKVVLAYYEVELRLLERWLLKPKTDEDHIKVAKEEESKYEFQSLSNEIEGRLRGNLLKEKEKA